MLTIRPVSYQEFKARPIALGSFQILEAELDKVKHRSYPIFDDDDDSDSVINVDRFVDQDDDTLGLITGIAQPRRYAYPNSGITSHDPFGYEYRTDHGIRELDYIVNNNAASDCVHSLTGAEHTQTSSCQAPARIQDALARYRLSMDSDRSSLSYTGLYMTNSRGSVFEAPTRSRWSVDTRPSNLIEGTHHTITSKRFPEDADNGVVSRYDYDFQQAAPSIMSSTGTLTPFHQSYASYNAEEDDFQFFLANAMREEEEAEMLTLLQRRSMRRREQRRVQKKRQKVGKFIKTSLKFIRQGFSNRGAL